MQSRALSPLVLLIWLPAALAGMAGVWLTLQGSAPAAVALFVMVGAFAVLVLKPVPALALLVVSRFSFEMFWDQRLYGFSVLDFLGAGVPVAVLIAIFLTRPRFIHIPLAKPLLAWTAVMIASAAVFVTARGQGLVVLENTLRYTCGVPIFLLTVIVVRDYEHAWRVLRLWLVGALPVAVVFFYYGESLAMEYHGVVRMKAFYHDVVTPAVVACLAMLISIFLCGKGMARRWRPHWILLLAVCIVVAARMLYLTFHNATAGVAFLSVLVYLCLRRRFGLVLGTVLFLVALTQVPRVQQRWWREVAILRGEQDAIAFASGRPNQWRGYIRRFWEMETVEKFVGVHGTWGDPENQFLQLVGDLGPFVTLLTLALLSWIVWTIHRWAREDDDPERKRFYHWIIAVLVGSVAAWMTATPLTYSNYQWFHLSLIGLAAAVRMNHPPAGAADAQEARA